MSSKSNQKKSGGRINSTLRRFLDSEAFGGLLLMATGLMAILVANSPLAPTYFSALRAYIGPLNLQHWINDALMALFFLMVGLEIKREFLDGQLSTTARRILPGVAAAGGMFVPAAISMWPSIVANRKLCAGGQFPRRQTLLSPLASCPCWARACLLPSRFSWRRLQSSTTSPL